MSYASIIEFKNIIGDAHYLNSFDKDGNALDDDLIVQDGLDNATSIIDSYLFKFLPILNVTYALRDACIWIANYNLTGDAATEFDRQKFDDVTKWLRDVGAGKASIGDASGDASGDAGLVNDSLAEIYSDELVFSRKKTEVF